MKHSIQTNFFSALLLGLVTFTFIACGGDDDETTPNTEKPDENGTDNNGSNDNGDNNGTPDKFVVTINDNGQASDGHLYTAIDDSTFYLDALKYKDQKDSLMVSGFDKATFKGEANIVSAMNYKGRFLEVKGIEDGAFGDCENLSTLSIPDGITSIGFEAFADCYNLTSITIPGSVTRIGDEAFEQCSALTTIIFNYGLISIGTNAFRKCTALKTVVIPNSVTIVGKKAFDQCTSLSSITIGSQVTTIETRAFVGCESLRDVYCLAKDCPNVGKEIFRETPISSGTLHVPLGSINQYKSTAPWSGFGRIVAIE